MSTVDRNNWREHCVEAELTGTEREELYALSAEIKAELFAGGDTPLSEFVGAHTKPEHDAYAAANLPRYWALLPAYADVYRRRDRAEIRAWREWVEREAKAAGR